MAANTTALDPTAAGKPSVPDLLRWRARHAPDQAPLDVDGREQITYAAWDRRSEAVARALLDRGVGKGDRVALLFGGMDWVDYAVAYLGVLKAGGTAMHLHERLDGQELCRRLDLATAVGTVHGAGVRLPAGAGGWQATAAALEEADAGRLGGGTEHAPADVVVAPDDIADILFTSGTTGPAKAFTNPHGNLSFGLALTGAANFDEAAPVLAPMPLGTSASAGTVALFALTTTATVIVCPDRDVERMAALVAERRVGSLMLTPWVAMRMVDTHVDERHDLSSVTTIGVASAPLPPRYGRALLELMPGATIRTAYGGGSEAVPASIVSAYDPDRPTRAGRPRPGTELRLVAGDGADVPDGEVGEIWLRTDAPKRRYLEEDRNDGLHVDGWVRTGDLGYIGPDGDLHFFDRGDDAIVAHGRLVSSITVEHALCDHASVREAAVIGVPDLTAGQRPVAVVVTRGAETLPDRPDTRRLVAELHAFLEPRLPPHERPRDIYVLASLPRGLTGKVLKHRLRARFGAPVPEAPGRSREGQASPSRV